MSDAIDQGMYSKGYRYRLAPQSGKFEPLYAKALTNIGPLMRDYPNEKFDVVRLATLRTSQIIAGELFLAGTLVHMHNPTDKEIAYNVSVAIGNHVFHGQVATKELDY